MIYLESVRLSLCDPFAKVHNNCCNDLRYLSHCNSENKGLNVVSNDYYSSTSVAPDSSNAWDVNFNNGNDNWDDKSNSNFVRCVRAGQ